jgi:hypothetical protein
LRDAHNLGHHEVMTSKNEGPVIEAGQRAITRAVRMDVSASGLRHKAIYELMGKEQTWFSRRWSGRVPWDAAELDLLYNIIGEDIQRCLAAATLAMEEARKMNRCSSCDGAEWRMTAWARRGYELARRLFGELPPDHPDLDPLDNNAVAA